MARRHAETTVVRYECPNCTHVARHRVVATTPGGETLRCERCGDSFTDAARRVRR